MINIPTNLSGNVDVNVANFGAGAWRAFVLMDGQFMGEIWDFAQGYSNLLETPAFRNGEHSIKAVTVDYNGDVTVSPVLEVTCNNLVHSAVASENFHPSENYKYKGLCSASGNLMASLVNDANTVIWSDTFSNSDINIAISGSTFTNEQLCDLLITQAGNPATTTKYLTKEFRASDYPYAARMVIVLPDSDVSSYRRKAIKACRKACSDRYVTHMVISGGQVTKEKLSNVFTNSNVEYIYWCGHANSKFGEVYRTHTECWQDNGQKIPVFSFTKKSKTNAYPLPGDLDNNENSRLDLWSLRMWEQPYIYKKIVFIDGCQSGTYYGPPDNHYNDMADAYGIYSQGGSGQIYIGWREKVDVPNPYNIIQVMFKRSTDAVELFWKRMGQGYTVAQTFHEIEQSSGLIAESFWGMDRIMALDAEPGDPFNDDNIKVYGAGLGLRLGGN